MPQFQDLTGQKFHRLAVIERDHNKNHKYTKWKCLCDCGNITIVSAQKLKISHTKSCGCLNRELLPDRARNMYKKNIKYEPRITCAREIWSQSYRDADLTFEQFLNLSQQKCHYCNKEPSNTANRLAKKDASQFFRENSKFIYNGLDRIDNNSSHTITNCCTCCKECNFSKINLTLENFIQMVKNICENKSNHILPYQNNLSNDVDLTKFKRIKNNLTTIYKDVKLTNKHLLLMTMPCFYCGAINSKKIKCKNGDIIECNGLDRTDQAKPHSFFQGLVPCCKYCNFSKTTRSAEEFIQWAERVYLNLKSNNLTSTT